MKYLRMIKKEIMELGRAYNLSSSDIDRITDEIIEEYKSIESISETWKKLSVLYSVMSTKICGTAIKDVRNLLEIDFSIECTIRVGSIWIKDANKKTRIIVNYSSLVGILKELKEAN